MKRILRLILSPYLPSYPATLVYMLQNTEYYATPYLAWYWRTQNFSEVAKRRELHRTRAALLLLVVTYAGIAVQILLGLYCILRWTQGDLAGGWAFGLALIVAYPVVWAHLIVLPLSLGRALIIVPRQRRLIAASEHIFKAHTGAKIAIVGSYGKTSMKELLLTVLREGKVVEATPANKNVPISHARFAASLSGGEDVLLIEYGEGAPGDVARFARITHPTHAVITGVAAAHLDRYKTVEAAGKDIFSVTGYVPDTHHCYVNGESPAAVPFVTPEFEQYTEAGTLGWKAHDVEVGVTGLQFTLSKGKHKLQLTSGLLGRHQVGPLSLAAALAHEFGMEHEAITVGIGKTQPFEHRMQPYRLGGAWIIDDTYNGNLEGIRAGCKLLFELHAKRKVYVTPGLVDQGKETASIHEEVGRLIVASGARLVVLMQNSVTAHIERGLASANFSGELRVESNPLEFYTNLTHFVSAGDVVLMQNDWPDNYA